jgi:hypothetical protein
MKKRMILAAVMAVVMTAALFCGPAAAETDMNADYVPGRIGDRDRNKNLTILGQKDGDVEYEAGYADGSLKQLEVELEKDSGEEYEVLYDASGKIVSAEYETDEGEISYDGSAWHDADGNEVTGPDLGFVKQYYDGYKIDRKAEPHRTHCVVGLPLRDLKPELTKKWYHVLPVDLTKEGTFRYRMVAGNLHYMGYCEVVIKDGKVTVDYMVPRGYVYPEKNVLAWFTNLDEITTEYLENPESRHRYGDPVDIATELKGQKVGLLFICNTLSYQVPYNQRNAFPVRFAPNSDDNRARRKELKALLDQIQ